MKNCLGTEEGIAHQYLPNGRILISVGLDQAPCVIDAAEGQGGTATVDAEVGIAGHRADVHHLGLGRGDQLGEIGPVGDFVASRATTRTGGKTIHQGGLEFTVAIDQLTHRGVEVGGGIGIEAEPRDIRSG